jgi:hypothetical protein
VVDVEFRRLKDLLGKPGAGRERADGGSVNKSGSMTQGPLNVGADTTTGHDANSSTYLDFTTLRNIHTTYLERLLTGCLLSNPALTAIIRPIFEVCERFVAQVERWGGDVLPALLFEGSIADDSADSVGAMVKERWAIVAEINGVIMSCCVCPNPSAHICSPDLAYSSRGVLRAVIFVYIPTAIHSRKRRVKIDPRQRQHCQCVKLPSHVYSTQRCQGT